MRNQRRRLTHSTSPERGSTFAKIHSPCGGGGRRVVELVGVATLLDKDQHLARQSHFIKDFKALTGRSPGAYAKGLPG